MSYRGAELREDLDGRAGPSRLPGRLHGPRHPRDRFTFVTHCAQRHARYAAFRGTCAALATSFAVSS